MMLPALHLLAALVLGAHTIGAQRIEDPAALVNLFIGTINGGHVFPGLCYHHLCVKSV